jgi:preprotein translocase subunit SecB
MKYVKNNYDCTYKVKDICFGSPGAPHGFVKGQKYPKLALKWGTG